MTAELLHPQTPGDVVDIVREAGSTGSRLLTVGGRRHMDKGNPTEVDAELWTTQLDDVIAYDPAEMLAVVGAGMRIGDLRALLADGAQEWPVDAPDDATVGGVIAAGTTSPRVLRVGAMRDSVVELTAVIGDGRSITSGARTVKNVSGYDVHRLMTGSMGTLGVIVSAALKVRPSPQAAITLLAHGDGPRDRGHDPPRGPHGSGGLLTRRGACSSRGLDGGGRGMLGADHRRTQDRARTGGRRRFPRLAHRGTDRRGRLGRPLRRR